MNKDRRKLTVPSVLKIFGVLLLCFVAVMALPFIFSVLLASLGFQWSEGMWWLDLTVLAFLHFVGGCLVGLLAGRIARSSWPIVVSGIALALFFLIGLLGGLGEGDFDVMTHAAVTALASWASALFGMLVVYTSRRSDREKER